MKKVPTKKARQLTDKQKAELRALEALPDDQIDTSDIPEIRDWSDARRGLWRAGTPALPDAPTRKRR